MRVPPSSCEHTTPAPGPPGGPARLPFSPEAHSLVGSGVRHGVRHGVRQRGSSSRPSAQSSASSFARPVAPVRTQAALVAQKRARPRRGAAPRLSSLHAHTQKARHASERETRIVPTSIGATCARGRGWCGENRRGAEGSPLRETSNRGEGKGWDSQAISAPERVRGVSRHPHGSLTERHITRRRHVGKQQATGGNASF